MQRENVGNNTHVRTPGSREGLHGYTQHQNILHTANVHEVLLLYEYRFLSYYCCTLGRVHTLCTLFAGRGCWCKTNGLSHFLFIVEVDGRSHGSFHYGRCYDPMEDSTPTIYGSVLIHVEAFTTTAVTEGSGPMK